MEVVLSLLLISPGSTLWMYPSPDLSVEEKKVHKITEMSIKVEHTETLYNQRKLELQVERGKQTDNFSLDLAGYFNPV